MKVLNIGYENFILADKVVAVVGPHSSPVRRLIVQARKSNYLVDATQGHKTRSVIVAESGQVILSALGTESIADRIKRKGT